MVARLALALLGHSPSLAVLNFLIERLLRVKSTRAVARPVNSASVFQKQPSSERLHQLDCRYRLL